MKNDEALKHSALRSSVMENRQFFKCANQQKRGAASGAEMRHKQHIFSRPEIDVFDPLVRIIVRLRVSNVPVCYVCWPSHSKAAVNGRPQVTLQAGTLMVPLRLLLHFLNALLWSGFASSPFF